MKNLFLLTSLLCWGCTAQVMAQSVSLPYAQDWEAGQGNWALVNDTFTNKWYVGTATANGSTQSLYISNNGTNNSYTSFETVVHAYIDVVFATGALGYKVSFDFKAFGETNQDYLRVWLVPATYTPVAGTQISAATTPGALNLSGNLNGKFSWAAAEYFIPASWAGTGRLVYEWSNNSSASVGPPAAVDNINIQQLNCLAPQDIDSTSVSGTNATVFWDKPDGFTGTGYEYIISTTEGSPTGPGIFTTDTFFTSGLFTPGQRIMFTSGQNATARITATGRFISLICR